MKNLNEFLTEKEKRAVEELKQGLKKLYGDNLARLILYGSKARGDSEDGSDIDILVALKKMGLRFDEIDRIGEIRAPICLKYNITLSVMPVLEEWIDADYKTIFVHNVLNEGVRINI
ncbi:MAG: nucleotidyltransferase domain-containing protein [Elusimicrobia bacterium HGW-Elusimicrobia-2]|nr:MAG: nucleotidyltransferase domain-containing protein [Elusimicrobia bacterium HGW-Elusimicrobia-2]